MRLRSLATICALCIVTTVVAGCARTRLGERIVDRHVTYAGWSKDGQTLYYRKYNGNLYSYDVKTTRKVVHRIPGVDRFAVSPDEKRIAFQRYQQGVCVANLESGTANLVYPSRYEVQALYWLDDDKLVFTTDTRKKNGLAMHLLDLGTSYETTLRGGAHAELCSTDGTGFVYHNNDDLHHVYRLADGSDTVLRSSMLTAKHTTIEFIYLSDRQVIYNAWPLNSDVVTEVLDLQTMRTRRVDLPGATAGMAMASDLRKYCYIGPYHQDTEPIKLYLVDIPPQIAKQLKSP